MRRHAARLGGLLLALAVLASVPASAAVVVLEALGTAQVEAGDQVLAVHGIDGARSVYEITADEPLSFELTLADCAASRNCQVRVRRGERTLDLPMWIDSVQLAPALDSSTFAELQAQLEKLGAADPPVVDLETLAARWHADDRTPAAAWLLGRLAIAAIARGDIDGALALEQRALGWLGKGQTAIAAQLRLNISRSLLAHDQADRATERLEQLQSELPPEVLKIAVVRTLAGVDFMAARLAEAEARLRSVVELARSIAPDSHTLAVTLNSLGVVIRPQGRLSEARELFAAAIAAARAFAPGSVTEAKIRANLGLLERASGDLTRAEAELRQALAILEKTGQFRELVYDTESNLALVLMDRGDTRAAAALWNQALPEAFHPQSEPADAEQLRRAGSAQQNLAMIHVQQGNAREAMRRAETAVELLRAGKADPLAEANALLDLGLYSSNAGAQNRAQEALEQARMLFEEAAPGGYGAITVDDALAGVARARGDPQRALALQRRAMERRDAGEHRQWQRDVALIQLGRIQLELGQNQAALAALELAERAARERGRDFTLASALSAKGEALLALGKKAEARASACTAVEHIEALRGTSPSGAEYRASFANIAAPIYRSCMDVLHAEGDRPAMLDLYQRERRLQLGALIADRDLRFADLPAQLLAERNAARAALGQVAAELEEAQAPDARKSLLEKRDSARRRLRQLDAALVEGLPRLASWRELAAQAPDTAPAGRRVLAYAVREHDSLRWEIVAGRDPQLRVLPVGRERLQKTIDAWRAAMLARDSSRERALARRLYDWLLADEARAAEQAPLYKNLADADPARLIIVPDGPLHSMAFAALLDPRERRLIATHSIELAALLPPATPVEARATAPIDLLAFGEGAPASSDRHAPLPGAGAELGALRALPWEHARLLEDRAATLAALRSDGPQARLLHFAVHGINDPTSPLDSALLLHRPDGRRAPLSVWEIFETLRLDADLVVLAACDTAPGVAVEDQGWLGLTRAFQFAGARRVISALWSVDDAATARLMGVMHRELAAGHSPDDALALAQRSFLEEAETSTTSVNRGVGGIGPAKPETTAAPFFWAAFHVYTAPL